MNCSFTSMIVEKSTNNNERMDDSNIGTAVVESENERNRTEPFQFAVLVEPFQFAVLVEPNSNQLLEENTNRTELEAEKVGSIRSLNSTTCPSNGIAHEKIESDGIPDRHTKKYQ